MSEPLSPGAVLVFDWGSTLMENFPQYSGAMADWPEVRAVDGAASALAALRNQHALVVGTNAADSDATLVWKALARAGLDQHLKAVFTTHEVDGARKPELRFFRHLENVLDRPPHGLVMIGDDYRVDICGAKAAGWRAIWYNPGHALAPGLLPLHDAEISAMDQLAEVVAHLGLPDYAACTAWLAERETPHNIFSHIQIVAGIAYALAGWLAASGAPVDPVLTHRGAMLHDLAKYQSIRLKKERGEGGDHAAMARDILLARGQPALAAIADTHMVSGDPQSPRQPQTWEERLVFYADKLAEGARLVALDERLAALQRRYPQYAASMETGWPVAAEIQEAICRGLEVSPADLIENLRHALGLHHHAG